MGIWLKERIFILLWLNGRDGFEEEGFSFGKMIGIPITCPATWFFISQTSTGVPQCSLLSEIEEVVLPKVHQPLGNASVLKGIKIVGDSTFSGMSHSWGHQQQERHRQEIFKDFFYERLSRKIQFVVEVSNHQRYQNKDVRLEKGLFLVI